MTDLIDRRKLIGIGAGALIVAPLIGCNQGEQATQPTGQPTGEQPPAPTGPSKAESEAHDVELLNNGILLEQTAIMAYQAAAGLPFIASDTAVMDVAKLFMSQHEEHRDRLAKWVEQLNGKPVDPKTAPAPEIPEAVRDATKSDDERKLAVLQYARNLELAAAEAYFQLVTQQLQTDLARRSAAEILPVEAQHVAVYDVVLKKVPPVSAALFSEQT
jgi:rubrerythrin